MSSGPTKECAVITTQHKECVSYSLISADEGRDLISADTRPSSPLKIYTGIYILSYDNHYYCRTMTTTVRKGVWRRFKMDETRGIHCNVFQTNLMLLTNVITRALLRKMYNQSEITAMRFPQQTFFYTHCPFN